MNTDRTPFYLIVKTGTGFAGVHFNRKPVTVELFGSFHSSRDIYINGLNEVFHIREERYFAWYSDSDKVLGVFDFELSTNLWTQKVKNLLYFGYNGSQLIVQDQEHSKSLDIFNGNVVSTENLTGKIIRSAHHDWKFFQIGKEISIQGLHKRISFSRKNYFGEIVWENDAVIFSERKGMLRKVELDSLEPILEIEPEKGSEFRKYQSNGEKLIITQHYFERPEETIVNWFDGSDRTQITIPNSGPHILNRDSSKVIFANRVAFLTQSGERCEFD